MGYSFDTLAVHPIQLMIKEASVTGSVGNTLEELHQAVRWVAEGKIKTVVDRTLGLKHFQEGIDSLKAGKLISRGGSDTLSRSRAGQLKSHARQAGGRSVVRRRNRVPYPGIAVLIGDLGNVDGGFEGFVLAEE